MFLDFETNFKTKSFIRTTTAKIKIYKFKNFKVLKFTQILIKLIEVSEINAHPF